MRRKEEQQQRISSDHFEFWLKTDADDSPQQKEERDVHHRIRDEMKWRKDESQTRAALAKWSAE